MHQLHHTDFPHHTQYQIRKQEDNIGSNFWMIILHIMTDAMGPTCNTLTGQVVITHNVEVS